MPEANTTFTVNSSLFNLDTFESEKVARQGTFSPASTMQEATERLGGDTAKILAILNDGLLETAKKQAREADGPWFTYDEEGKLTTEEFSGTPANEDAVNSLKLSLAKSIYGFNKSMTPEQKRAAKEKALNLIRNTAEMRDGLKAKIGASAE